MIGGLVALAIAAIGVAYGTLVLRAAPTRHDNLAFGVLALVDGTMTAWRGLNVIAGDSIVDAAVTIPCSIFTIVLAVLSVEFLAAFPGRPRIGWRWRALLLAWAVAATVTVILEGRRGVHFIYSQWTFFLPITLIIIALGIRSWRLTKRRDARTVIGMMWFRWVFGFSAYLLAPMLGVFEAAVWAETTFATLVSFIVIGTAVLRSELFSIRSAAAEVTVFATLALIVVVGGGSAVWLVQRWTEPGTLQSALLVGATLVPLGLAGLGSALYPRVERRVLAPLDERRARRLGVQGDPLPTDAAAAITEATRRIAAIASDETTTANVRWAGAANLPPALAGELRDGQPRRKEHPDPAREAELGPAVSGQMPRIGPEMPACFVVPALGADRTLVGAFTIDGGLIDRDTYLVARDLAARIALVVERTEAIKALEDARRLAALGQFAAAIAHDIRTPLTSISLNVQILRGKLELSEDDREHFDIALEELQRLDASVAEILDFAKPVRLSNEPVDIAELLETAASTMSPVLSEKHISLRMGAPGDGIPALRVTGDSQRLRQVIVNLVGNAADASKPGTHVTLRAQPADNGNIAIEVEDQGRGIGADDLPRIFDPFFTTRPDGTGLGLAICHKVVRAHGGDIHVRSTVGEGSTFTVVLPAA